MGFLPPDHPNMAVANMLAQHMSETDANTLLGIGNNRLATQRKGSWTTLRASTTEQEVVIIADTQRVGRWRIVLQITDPNGSLPAGNYGAGVIVRTYPSVDNEVINKEIRVGVGNSATFFEVGRGLKIRADNPFASDLRVDFQLDDNVSGIAVWQCFRLFTLAATTETPVSVPNFARSMVLYSQKPAATTVTVRQYINGTLYYEALHPMPFSPEIQLLQGAAVTVEASTSNTNLAALFNCVG